MLAERFHMVSLHDWMEVARIFFILGYLPDF